MRFVFTGYIQTPGYNNPQDWIQRLAAYFGVLEELAKNHDVISIEQTGYAGDYQHKGVKYLFRDFGGPVLHFPSRLHALIKERAPDIIVVHGDDFPLQLIQLRIRVGKGPKIIVQSHSKEPPSGYKKWLQKIADRYVDAYFFTSAQMALPWLHKKCIGDAGKIHEVMVGSSILHPLDKQEARTIKNCNDSLVFLWVGRLNDNKDPLTAMGAFRQFFTRCPHAKMYMIYQTDERINEINLWINENGATDCIQLVGKVDHADMSTWFSAADFFISTSRFEVFGAVVPEAVSCNCIPILPGIDSFRTITSGGEIGLLYTPGDSQSLQHALLRTLEMDIIAEQEKMKAYYEKYLSFSAIAGKIHRVAASL